jgi:hypothetical protein
MSMEDGELDEDFYYEGSDEDIAEEDSEIDGL